MLVVVSLLMLMEILGILTIPTLAERAYFS
jgi:hypothetical protein